MTPNIADIIRHHVSLEVRCLDRLYLHAYMPKLQTSDGLLLLARPSRQSDPVACAVQADARSIRDGRRTVCQSPRHSGRALRARTGHRRDRHGAPRALHRS
jgi:hypothetical protein